jgi:hypothetical protein
VAVDSAPARPQWTEEQLAPYGHVLLLAPRVARSLRIIPRAPTDSPWILTGLQVGLRDPSPQAAAPPLGEEPDETAE